MVGTRVRYAAFSFLIAHRSGLLARRQRPVLEFAEASNARWRRNAAMTGSGRGPGSNPEAAGDVSGSGVVSGVGVDVSGSRLKIKDRFKFQNG